jgi:hypothetical protein
VQGGVPLPRNWNSLSGKMLSHECSSQTEVRAAAILILAELFGKAADDTVS